MSLASQLNLIVTKSSRREYSDINIEDHPTRDNLVVVSDSQFTWLSSRELVESWIEHHSHIDADELEDEEDLYNLWNAFCDDVPAVVDNQAAIELWEYVGKYIPLHDISIDNWEVEI